MWKQDTSISHSDIPLSVDKGETTGQHWKGEKEQEASGHVPHSYLSTIGHERRKEQAKRTKKQNKWQAANTTHANKYRHGVVKQKACTAVPSPRNLRASALGVDACAAEVGHARCDQQQVPSFTLHQTTNRCFLSRCRTLLGSSFLRPNPGDGMYSSSASAST